MKVFIVMLCHYDNGVISYREVWHVSSTMEKAKAWAYDHRQVEIHDGANGFTKSFYIEEYEIDEA